MQLPNTQEITALFDHYHTPEHIRSHMRVVAEIAKRLATAQRDELGKPLSVERVTTAALLHDLVRIPDQYPYVPHGVTTPAPHAEINYGILQEEYPEVANIIRDHSLMSIFEEGRLDTLEKQIVYYADKRVNHDVPVLLQDRLQLGQERWTIDPENDRSEELLRTLTELENTLFAGISYTPESIVQDLL